MPPPGWQILFDHKQKPTLCLTRRTDGSVLSPAVGQASSMHIAGSKIDATAFLTVRLQK
jgi:hypothetical protein